MLGMAVRAGRVAWDARRAEAGGVRALRERQHARFRALVADARAWSRYYARLYADVAPGIVDPAALPPTSKRDLMAHFDDWVTDPLVVRGGIDRFVGDLSRVGEPYLGRYLVGTTSGTTGEPAILLEDAPALSAMYGLGIARRRRSLPRAAWSRVPTDLRVAMIVATGGHFMAVAAIERARRSSPFVAERYRVFSVLEPLGDLVRQLNAFRPLMVAGYASALALLADEQQAGRLHIAPAAVWSSAETLTAPARASMQAAFRAPVREVYGSSEVLHAASECPAGSIHVNEDWALLEPVDAQYRAVPPGVPSHTVLVTNLANRVQPIIRYDLGDSITELPGNCRCGSALRAIRPEGRDDDVLFLPGRVGARAVRVLPLAIGSVVEEVQGVLRSQLELTASNRLIVRLVVAPGCDRGDVWAAVESRLRAWLTEQGVAGVTLALDAGEPARDPRSGKFRAVSTGPGAVRTV